MEALVGIINVYETEEYNKFFVNGKYNRPVKKDQKYRDLYNSIKENGQITPIIVKVIDNLYHIAEGQHRFEILKEMGLPIKFCIDNNIDLPVIVNAGSTISEFHASDFIAMGTYRDIPVFVLISRLFYAKENKMNITSILEIVFTFVENKAKSVFSNRKFIADCKSNYEKAYEKYNKIITDDMINEIDYFITLIDRLSEGLEISKVNVNCVKELLRYHLCHKSCGITLENIILYLIKQKPSKFSDATFLKNAKNNGQVSRILDDIEYKLTKNIK